MPFKRPTLSELKSRNRGDLNVSEITLTKRVLADVHAAGCHGLHGHLDWNARQILVTTCDPDRVERFGSLYGMTRKAADNAKGMIEFRGIDGAIIPAGTIVQRSDRVQYKTVAEAYIVNQSEMVAVEALEGGVFANTGAGATLKLIRTIPGLNSTVSAPFGLHGGINEEDIESYRDRIILRQQLTPHGGAKHDYERWALEVSGTTRAWCTPMGLGVGTVSIHVVNDRIDPIALSQDKLDEIKTHIESVCSVIAHIHVFTPILVPVDIDVARLTPNTEKVRQAVTAELKAMIVRESAPGATLLLSHIREAVSIAAGEHDHRIDNITDDITFKSGEMPVPGEVRFV